MAYQNTYGPEDPNASYNNHLRKATQRNIETQKKQRYFKQITDQLDSQTTDKYKIYSGDEKQQSNANFKRILSSIPPELREEYQQYVKERWENDEWFDGNTEEFFEEINDRMGQMIQTDSETGRKAVEAQQKQLSENRVKEFTNTYDDTIQKYDDYENQVRDTAGSIEDDLRAQSDDLIKQYDVSQDLVDENIGQARHIASAPSVVNETIQSQLADNTRNDILQRQANRSRYGSGMSNPNQRQMDDRLALARSSAAQRMEEDLKRQAMLQQSLGAGAQSKFALAQGKNAALLPHAGIRQNNLGLIQGAQTRTQNLKIGRTGTLMGLGQAVDNEELRKIQFEEGRRYRQGETGRQLERQAYATGQQRWGIGKAVGGVSLAAAGLATGNPALIGVAGGLGTSLATDGWNDWNAGTTNLAAANKLSRNYYGNEDSPFVPAGVYTNKRIAHGSNQFGDELGKLGKQAFSKQGLDKWGEKVKTNQKARDLLRTKQGTSGNFFGNVGTDIVQNSKDIFF